MEQVRVTRRPRQKCAYVALRVSMLSVCEFYAYSVQYRND